MQAVIFHVGPERFAIDTASVAEVIPGIPARRVPAAHPALVGVIDYRGQIVPVLDLCRLFERGDCPVQLANRILICDLTGGGRRWGEAAGEADLLGILAENVTRVGALDLDAPGSHPGPESASIRGLGRIVHDGDGLVQLVGVTELIPADVLASVRRKALEETSG